MTECWHVYPNFLVDILRARLAESTGALREVLFHDAKLGLSGKGNNPRPVPRIQA